MVPLRGATLPYGEGVGERLLHASLHLGCESVKEKMGEDLIFGHFIEDLTVDEGKLEGKEAKKWEKEDE